MHDTGRRDPSALEMLHRVGGDKLVRKMGALFSANAPLRLTAIRSALDSDNTAAAVNPAHSLKSSAGQLGVKEIQELCDKIESACSAGNAPVARTLLDSANEALPAALEWIDNWRPQE